MNPIAFLPALVLLALGVACGFWPLSRKIMGAIAGAAALTDLASSLGNSIEYHLRAGAMGSHGMPSFAGMAIGAGAGLLIGGIGGYLLGRNPVTYWLLVVAAVLMLIPWPSR